MFRNSSYNKLNWKCHGKVIRKFISTNHAQKSIEILGHKTIIFEGISQELWKHVKVGDSIHKKPWNEFALINDKPIRIIYRGSYLNICGYKLPKKHDSYKNNL